MTSVPSKNPLIALLLSLFVMPGLGHVYLGQKIKGYVISLAICLILLILFIIFERELLRQTISLPEPRLIFAKTFELAKNAWLKQINLYLGGIGLMILIWIYAAVDVMRKK